MYLEARVERQTTKLMGLCEIVLSVMVVRDMHIDSGTKPSSNKEEKKRERISRRMHELKGLGMSTVMKKML